MAVRSLPRGSIRGSARSFGALGRAQAIIEEGAVRAATSGRGRTTAARAIMAARMPGDTKRLIIERTPHHAIGLYSDDLVMVCAFRGSEDDPRHVWAAGDAVASTARRTGTQVNALFVLAETGGVKPPSSAVRESITKVARRHEAVVGKLVVVMGGEGFGPAIHRAVLGTIVVFFRPTVPVLVGATVREGLKHVFQDDAVIEDALQFYERDLVAKP